MADACEHLHLTAAWVGGEVKVWCSTVTGCGKVLGVLGATLTKVETPNAARFKRIWKKLGGRVRSKPEANPFMCRLGCPLGFAEQSNRDRHEAEHGAPSRCDRPCLIKGHGDCVGPRSHPFRNGHFCAKCRDHEFWGIPYAR